MVPMDMFLSILATFVIIFVIPVIVYAIFAKYKLVQEPEKKARFFASVVIQKIGTSIGFVTLFTLQNTDSWLTYGLLWTLMFAIVEIGQSLSDIYTKNDAIAGILSELIYFPLAAYAVHLLLT